MESGSDSDRCSDTEELTQHDDDSNYGSTSDAYENDLFVNQIRPGSANGSNETGKDERNDYLYDSCEEDTTSDDEDELRYTERREQFPNQAAYDPKLYDVKREIRGIASRIIDTLEKDDCKTDRVEIFRKNAGTYRKIPLGDIPVIGLIGNSGQGKSSIVNAIADIPDLAKALDLGESVTYTAMVYQRAFDKQQKKFSAEIEYFDIPTITKLLNEAVDDWNDFWFGPKEDMTLEERNNAERKASTTLSIFRAVFGDMDSFRDDETGTESLNELCKSGLSGTEKVQVYTDCLEIRMDKRRENMALLQQRLRVQTAVGDDGDQFHEDILKEYIEADDTEELGQWLDQHLSEDSYACQATMWPMVRQVNVRVKGSRVLNRVSIADLPGISDTHRVRVENTLRHIEHCTRLFAVDRIGRVATNDLVDNVLRKYAKAFKGQVDIICTKCDENISPKEAKSLISRGISIPQFQSWNTNSKMYARSIKELRAELLQEKRRKLSSERPRTSEQVRRELEEVETQEKLQTALCLEAVTAARNAHVIKNLWMKYQPLMPRGSHLQVFCVSNTHYESHKRGGLRNDMFQLSIEGTGIPALRAHILELAAPSRLRGITDFVDGTFQKFLARIKLWAENTDGEFIASLGDLIGIAVQRKSPIPGAFEEYCENTNIAVQECLIDHLEREQEAYCECALRFVDNTLAKKAWATLKAFVRREGNWQTPSMSGSWNEQFTQGVKATIDSRWEALDASIEANLSELSRKVEVIVKSILGALKDAAASIALPMEDFERAFRAHLISLRQCFRTAEEHMGRELRTIRIHATTDGPSNYFAMAMADVYRETKKDSGKGVKQRFIGRFQQAVSYNHRTETSIFATIAQSIQEAFATAIDSQADVLKEHIDQTFVNIIANLEEMISKKSEDHEEVHLRGKLKDLMRKAMDDFDEVKGTLESIKGRYPLDV